KTCGRLTVLDILVLCQRRSWASGFRTFNLIRLCSSFFVALKENQKDHYESKALDEIFCAPASSISFHASSTEPSRSMPFTASSTTCISKPSFIPSNTDHLTQKSVASPTT